MTQENILVIQPLPGLGDLAWFHEHMTAIADRASDKKITLLTKPAIAPQIFQGSPYIKEVLVAKKTSLFSLVRLLKSRSFTEVWILHHSWRYTIACKLAGIKVVYGYGRHLGHFFLQNPRLTRHEFHSHPIKRADHLIQKHGLKPTGNLFQANKNEMETIEERLGGFPKPWIALGIGGSESFKKWPLESFASLARYLEDYGTVFVFAGKQEEEEAKLIAQLGVVNLTSRIIPLTHLSIQESLGFLSLCDLFVGNDTGMLNFAAILGKPSVGLFLKTPSLNYKENMYPLVTDSKGKIDPKTVIGLLKSKKLI
ncbi:MAG: glycosyltransferase family 9 protein [Alphaproteobacteria bacterium]